MRTYHFQVGRWWKLPVTRTASYAVGGGDKTDADEYLASAVVVDYSQMLWYYLIYPFFCIVFFLVSLRVGVCFYLSMFNIYCLSCFFRSSIFFRLTTNTKRTIFCSLRTFCFDENWENNLKSLENVCFTFRTNARQLFHLIHLEIEEE